MPKPVATPTAKLPPGIIASDLTYPKDYKDQAYDAGDHGKLTFHYIFGRRDSYWCLATLFIGGGGRRSNYAERTYAITLDGKLCRVGRGPHVQQTITVYIRKSRIAALQKYIDLHRTGLADAGMVRDRISSRRAQGQMERAAGNTYWRWNV